MFRIFTEKQAFDDIVLFPENLPNWHHIALHHAEICLNVSQETFDQEVVAEQSILFEYIKLTGGRLPIAHSAFFDDLQDAPEQMAAEPHAAFFLDVDTTTAEDFQKRFGVIVQPSSAVDDSIVKGTFFRELPQNTVVDNGGSNGWKALIDFPLPPSNAMVISDDYLFANEEKGMNVGVANLVGLIDAFLPPSIAVPYHIAIVANDDPNGKAPKPEAWCIQTAGKLMTEIRALRPYPIHVEVVFTQAMHKRRVMLNYLSGSCDKGFAMFRATDRKTVRADNDFRCDRIFQHLFPHEGTTDFHSMITALQQIQKRCQSVKTFIGNAGQSTQNRILGDCRPDYSITNRLINAV
jgi:hypothetical protein